MENREGFLTEPATSHPSWCPVPMSNGMPVYMRNPFVGRLPHNFVPLPTNNLHSLPQISHLQFPTYVPPQHLPTGMYPPNVGFPMNPSFTKQQGAESDLRAIENHIHELLMFKKGPVEEEETLPLDEEQAAVTDEEEDAQEELPHHQDTLHEEYAPVTNSLQHHHQNNNNNNKNSNNSNSSNDKRWVVKNKTPSAAFPGPSKEKLDLLTKDMLSTAASLMPPANELDRKVGVLKKLQGIVSRIWPGSACR